MAASEAAEPASVAVARILATSWRGDALSTFTPDAALALEGPDWLRARRAEAVERFRATPLPTPEEEVWRYSRISELDLDAYVPAPHDASAGLPPELEAVLATVGTVSGVVLAHNGHVVRADLDPQLAARGVVAGGLASLADGGELLGAVTGGGDVFVDLNTAFGPGGVVVRVPAGVAVEHPVVVLHWTDADGAAVFPRTVVRAGPGSQVTVLDHVASADVRALVVPVVELDAADASNLRYLNVQQLGRQVWQIARQSSRVGKEANLVTAMVALGGDYARVRAESALAGPGASSRMLAVYFGDGTQMPDFRTTQDHDAGRTMSDLCFKGAVADEAHAVYTGLIRVKKGAAGTRAFQTNRNLVLSDGASANSVPNLEIEENDVSCSHASAVGPIDEEQRFYLEARGVPTEVAQRLIVLGFFDDVIQQTPISGLRPALRAAVTAKLEGTIS